MQEKKYIPAVDVLRAVAILLVVWHHVGQGWLTGYAANPFKNLWNETWNGVDLFFVVSGFVVSRSLLPVIDGASPGLGIRDFYLRRMFRLFPVAWLWLLFAFCSQALFPLYKTPFNLAAAQKEVFAVLFYFENFYINTGVHGLFSWFWSLSIEEQFYLSFPVLFFFLKKKSQRTALILSYVAMITFVVRPWYVQGGAKNWPTLRTTTWLKFDDIFLGVLLTLHLDRVKVWVRKIKFWFMAWAGAVALFVIPKLVNQLAVQHTLIALVSLLMVTVAGSSTAAEISSPLERFFIWIGKRSYILYLAQLPVFQIVRYFADQLEVTSVALRIFSAFALILLLTELSYRYVEQPMIRFGKHFIQIIRARTKVTA